jgi:hypothetical protein
MDRWIFLQIRRNFPQKSRYIGIDFDMNHSPGVYRKFGLVERKLALV